MSLRADALDPPRQPAPGTSGEALQRHAADVLERLLGLQQGDEVVLVTDPTADEEVVAAVRAAALDSGARTVTLAVPEVVQLGDRLDGPVDGALAQADVALLVTQWLPAWVAARGFWRAVHEYGTRVLQFDPPYRIALENGLTDAELEAVVQNSRVLRERVRGATELLIVDRFGNELRCGVDATNLSVSDHFPTAFGFAKFPVGLFTLGVRPGTYSGRIVWDAVEGVPWREGDRIEIEAAEGAVTCVSGVGAGMEFVARQVALAPAYALLTEFGLGTNPALPEEAFLREDWHEGVNRSAGILHFGLGSSRTPGADGRIFHTHLVTREASVLTLPDRGVVLMDGRV